LYNCTARRRTNHAQALLAEVVVDVGGLHRQVAGRVEGVAFVLRRLIGRLADGQQVWTARGQGPEALAQQYSMVQQIMN